MEERTVRESQPEKNMINSILTLRYNLSLKPSLPKKEWKDFQEHQSHISTPSIEKIIKNSIKNSFTNTPKNIAIALSGGVDSTLVLTLLRDVFPDLEIEAFSIKFADSVDETEKAKDIANHFNANHNTIFLENYLSELPKAISIIEMPFWDLHWYYVVKNTSKKSKFLASGDGGDELFGGYTFRYEKFLKLTTPNSSPLEKVKAYLECHERDRVPDQEQLFGPKSNFSWNEIYQILIPYFDNSLPSLSQVFLADYNGKLLYNFSPINSRIHRHFRIQSLAPLLSNEVISLSTHLPINSKYNQNSNTGKLVLREILKKHGSDIFLSKEKLGFNVNTLNLWKSNGFELCKFYLHDSRIVKDGWISDDWIKKFINRTDLDIRYVNKFLGLLAFEIWYRLFVTKEMSSTTIL